MVNIFYTIIILAIFGFGLYLGVMGIVKPVKVSKSLFLNEKGAFLRAVYFTAATISINTAFAIYYPNSAWLITTLIIFIPIWIEYLINIQRAKLDRDNFSNYSAENEVKAG